MHMYIFLAFHYWCTRVFAHLLCSVNDWSMFLGPDIYHSPILWGGVSDMVVTLPNATFTASAVARWGEPVYEAIPSWSEYW